MKMKIGYMVIGYSTKDAMNAHLVEMNITCLQESNQFTKDFRKAQLFGNERQAIQRINERVEAGVLAPMSIVKVYSKY